MISVCTFLANLAMLPTELMKLDEAYLNKFESLDFSEAQKHAEVQESNLFVNSSSKP